MSGNKNPWWESHRTTEQSYESGTIHRNYALRRNKESTMGNAHWLLNWTIKDNWWRTNSVKRWATTLGEIQRRIRVTWAKPTGTLIEPQWISKGDNREGIHQGQETKGEQRKAHKWYKNPWWSAEWIMKQFKEHTQRVNPNAIRCHIGNNPWQHKNWTTSDRRLR